MLEEMKRTLKSPQTWIAFIVCFITLMGYSFVYWIGSANEWIEYRESALHLSIGGIFFGGFMLLLPFCAALVHATNQIDDICTSMMHWKTIRHSLRKYISTNVGVSMIISALSASGAYVLHAIIWNIVALPNDPAIYPNHTIYFSKECVFYDWYLVMHGLPVYIEMTLGIAFTASIWSVAALAISVWIPDKLLAVVIPSFIYYLWNADVFYFLTGIKTPHPAILFSDGLTVEKAIISIGSYLMLLIISLVLYCCGCERRCKNV